MVGLRAGDHLYVDASLPFNPYHCTKKRSIPGSMLNVKSRERKDFDSTICTILEGFKENCTEGTNYLRNEATDIVAFVIADSQRLHRPGIPPHIPVAYAMKSASLSTSLMRKMLSDVRQACREHNATIMCKITDGEFLKIANSSETGQPLTLLQRLKWRYKFFDRHSKQQMLDIIMLRIHPPYNYKWHEVRTINSSRIIHAFTRRLDERKKKKKSTTEIHDKATLNVEECLELLDCTKLARKLKQPKYQAQLRKYGYRNNKGSGMQISTTSEEGNSEVQDISGTSSQSEELPAMEYYNDSSDGDFTASENESESDEDVNAVISFADENYSVDFPGKPEDFDEDMEAHIFHPCLSSILEKLQHSKYQAKWSTYDVRTLVDSYLMAPHKLAKLKHPEMNIIQAEIYKYFGKKIFNVTSLKAVKVEQLAKQFCPHYINVAAVATTDCIRDSGFTDKMYTLKECARRCIMLSGYPKELLKIVVCQMTNDDDLQEWLDASPVPCVIDIPEAGITHRIFCYPFFNEITHELECRSLDPSHILNNLRS